MNTLESQIESITNNLMANVEEAMQKVKVLIEIESRKLLNERHQME